MISSASSKKHRCAVPTIVSLLITRCHLVILCCHGYAAVLCSIAVKNPSNRMVVTRRVQMAFHGFQEAHIDFAPTFKINTKSESLNPK